MKWVELVEGKSIFLEIVDENSVWGYYFHNYSDLNQNQWFIKGKVVKSKKEFLIELTEPEWLSCKEFLFIKITNKKVCDYLKNIKINEVEINNLRKVLY